MKADVKRVNASSATNSEKVQQLQILRLQPIREQGRKLALAYLGLWGIVCDQVGGLHQSSEKLLNDAVERGEQMEEALYAMLAEWSRCITKQQTPFRKQVETDFRRTAQAANEAGQDFEAQLERQVERALAKLGIPTRERLAKLNQEIERLNAILDEKLAQKEAVHA